MKVYRLIYNSFIWGMLVSILAFQNTWLEMRMNIGIIIPIFMALCLIVGILLKKAGKEQLLSLSKAFTIINVLICTVMSLLVLGFERIQVVPASIVREGLKITYVSFDSMNIALLILVFGGVVLSCLGREEIEMKNFKNIFKGVAGKVLGILVIVFLCLQ